MTQISKLSPKKLPKRISTRHGGLTRILGGGLVPGSLVVLTGVPGIGKTTLALQVLDWVMRGGKLEAVHFITTEQTRADIRLLAERVDFSNKHKCRVNCLTFLPDVTAAISLYGAKLVVVDSLQGMGRTPKAMRVACEKLKKLAVEREIVIIATSHALRKDGLPASAASSVDVILRMVYDEHVIGLTIISTPKNRFGSSLASTMLPYAIRGGGLVKGFKRAMR